MNSDGQLVRLTARLPVGPATSNGHVIVTVGEPSGAIGTAGLFTRAFDLALATAASSQLDSHNSSVASTYQGVQLMNLPG
jgi:hypothetical protein